MTTMIHVTNDDLKQYTNPENSLQQYAVIVVSDNTTYGKKINYKI